MRQFERKGDHWKTELERLDRELVSAAVPPLLRPQFLLVTFGDVVPQTWTDYDEEPPKRQQGTAEPITVGSRSARSPEPQRFSRAVRSRSRRRSRSRDKGRRDRSKERRS